MCGVVDPAWRICHERKVGPERSPRSLSTTTNRSVMSHDAFPSRKVGAAIGEVDDVDLHMYM